MLRKRTPPRMRVKLFPLLMVSSWVGLAQAPRAEHWVSTWATAETLMARAPLAPGANRGGPVGGPTPNSQTTNASGGPGLASPVQRPRGNGIPPIPATFKDETIRMVVRSTIGGSRLRIEVSNMLGVNPVEIGAAHVALHKGAGAIVPGTDRALTFSGKPSFVIPPGVLAVSDPIGFDVAPFTDLAVS